MKGLFAGIEIIKLEIQCTFSIILLKKKKKAHSGFSEEEINHSEGSGWGFLEHCIHHEIYDTVPKEYYLPFQNYFLYSLLFQRYG